MPTYDYICENCGCEFEKFQSITENALRKCPECKKLKLKRLIGTGAGVIFKGSGFYQTDYRSEGYKQAEKKKTETKPAVTESTAASATKTETPKAEKKEPTASKPETKAKKEK